MPIPDHLVEDIRQRADIVEILSEHTRLRRTGKTYRGPCPLHGGEGPNFSVDPAKGFYKCFTCGEGGTVYSFLMKHLGMTYPESIRWVAERVGVEIPDEREERRAQAEDPNRLLYEINGFAAKWFRDQLASPDGAEARDYLKRRGITPETIERFGLGWAPESFDALGTAARKAGYHGADLLALGLLKEPKKAGRDPYDAFRGRVIFPIEDLGGRVLGFGGRVLQQVEAHIPKYLNSPESEIYHKGSTLYGLGWSRGSIRKEEVALVVEGYMDYVSLAAHGVTHAVAPLGTAMTEEQAALVKQYAPRAILLYDSDKAGLKATFRNGDQLLRAGVEVLVATLPEGEDPDSLVRAQGADALRRYLDDAVDVLERKLLLLDRKNFFGSIKGTRRAIDLLLPTVRATRDEVLRGVYLKRISDRTGVPVDALTREAAEVVDAPTRREMRSQQRQEQPLTRQDDGWGDGRGNGRGEGGRDRQQWHGRPRDGERQGSRWNADRPLATPALRLRMGAERNLLMMMFHSERWVEECAKFVGPDDFQDPDYRRLFRVLIETEGRRDPEGRWLLEFPEELAGDVETVRGDAEHCDWSGAPVFFAENMDRILARPLEREARSIKHRAQSGGEVDPDMLAELQQQLLLKRENRNLKVRPGILDPDDPILRRDRERR
ncbi:DNA primase [Longimicrobium sp.]|uniref:DNA primase n=1 Tax=Longimicrobium sp. TaxID=2029185 RepID=UPI002F95DC81